MRGPLPNSAGVKSRAGRPFSAGAYYFALVFPAGFVLGVARTLFLAPAVGEVGAVLIETPLMLCLSWLACGWVLRRLRLPPDLDARVVMGSTAFLLLMAAEAAVSMLLVGRTFAEHLATYARAAAIPGPSAQLLYASFPIARR
jgi:hypothetical protein